MQVYPSAQTSGAGSIVIQGSAPEACWCIRPYRADDREAVMRLQTDSFFQVSWCMQMGCCMLLTIPSRRL